MYTDVIKQAGIDPKSRAENLTIAEYEKLALKVLDIVGQYKSILTFV